MTGSFLTLFSFSFPLHPLADDLVHELPVRAASKPLHRLPHERGDRALASGCDEVATLRDDLVDDPLDLLAGGAFEPQPLPRIPGARAGPRLPPRAWGDPLLGKAPRLPGREQPPQSTFGDRAHREPLPPDLRDRVQQDGGDEGRVPEVRGDRLEHVVARLLDELAGLLLVDLVPLREPRRAPLRRLREIPRQPL